MKILSIETSCDETAAAVTDGRKVLGNSIYSQILIHKKWGGVVPSLAKKAHEERIDFIIEDALKKAKTKIERVDYIAVTYGPGLAIALEVGINKAKELSKKHYKKIIAVNHMEGHLYASFGQNSKGKPEFDFKFPYIGLLVSGGHTEIVLFKDHIDYKILGETVDDAAGEALDKAAKMLNLGYPGGPVIERLASEVRNKDFYKLPRPMTKSKDLNFSFSGLKTSFFYMLKEMKEVDKKSKIKELASSFQEAVFDSILLKLERAMNQTEIKNCVVGGGVIANQYLRKKLRALTKKYNGEIIFPPYKYLCTDNAAMIGIAAYYKAQKKMTVKNLKGLDRIPRLKL